MIKKINEEIFLNMKQGNSKKVLALKCLKAELENNLKDKVQKNEMDVILSYKNKLIKSKESYSGNFEKQKEIDLEIEIVQSFLPNQMSEESVRTLILSTMEGLIENNRNIGSIMKIIQPEIKGKFDGKRLSDLIKEILAK